MFQPFHNWRLAQHIGHGNARMALDVLWTGPEEFSFTDALIFTAWIEGAKDELERRCRTSAV